MEDGKLAKPEVLLSLKDSGSPGKRAGLLKAGALTGCDWDGDGDHDLLAGTIDGKVYLLTNGGTREKPRFAARVLIDPKARGYAGTAFRTAGPCAADWDRDGDFDLVVGTESNGVLLFRNVGTGTEPRLAKAVELLPDGKPFRRGYRMKPHVTDWNEDGLSDLLIGTADEIQNRTHGFVWLSLRLAKSKKAERPRTR
jgi:hypothetical protein